MPQPQRPLDPLRDPESMFGAELRHLRERAGLPQSQVGARVHVSGSLIGKIEKAERQCDRSLALLLDEVLGADGSLERLWLYLFSDADRSKPADRARMSGGVSERPDNVDTWEDELSVARRMQTVASSNVDDATLTVLRAGCDDVVERYEAEGPQGLAPTTRHLRQAVHQLLAGPQHPSQRQQLYELAAMASGLLAYMAVNAGRLRLARSYCAEALQLSKAIEDRNLTAWVHGTQSLEAYYDGRYADARKYALEGLAAAPDGPQAIRLLANGAARAYGKLGDRYAAEEAIDQALELTERHQPQRGLTPCIAFAPYGRARTLANAATAYVSLGDAVKVVELAGEIDQHIERADSAWSRALVSLDVASALISRPRPDVEEAMALGAAALASCRTHPIRSVVQRASELSERATARWPEVREVRDYAEVLLEWQAKPAAGILPRG